MLGAKFLQNLAKESLEGVIYMGPCVCVCGLLHEALSIQGLEPPPPVMTGHTNPLCPPM